MVRSEDAQTSRPQDIAPWQVRMVEQYIEANWDQPITIEALTIVTGLSSRSIFHSFQKSRGYSPMDFARSTRLNHAREMLLDSCSDNSVTKVAFACAFGNLGHFSHYYSRKFGELPSQTARRARAARSLDAERRPMRRSCPAFSE